MYRKNAISKKCLKVNESYDAEALHIKIQRLVQNKEPLDGTVPLTYTERKDGVKAEYNIRTDRWEIATDAMDKVSKSNIAKRDNKGKAPVKDMDGKDVTSIDTDTGGKSKEGGA